MILLKLILFCGLIMTTPANSAKAQQPADAVHSTQEAPPEELNNYDSIRWRRKVEAIEQKKKDNVEKEKKRRAAKLRLQKKEVVSGEVEDRGPASIVLRKEKKR